MQALVSDGKLFHCSVFRVHKESAQNQIKAQRSGFDLKRRHSEVNEVSPIGGSE